MVVEKHARADARHDDDDQREAAEDVEESTHHLDANLSTYSTRASWAVDHNDADARQSRFRRYPDPLSTRHLVELIHA
jgi:hypothetical protein